MSKSCCRFFFAFLASSAQRTEQYFRIPLLVVNALPQNTHFLVVFILPFFDISHSFRVFYREVNIGQPLSSVVNRVNICGSLRIFLCRLSPLVNGCKPMSTGFDFVAIKNPVHSPR
ncbi:hypothetical protein [Bacteroides fragilis]|uniref:hypothetical protein n=1 Tax=Bacteroides fragilis TaxID=817 RepID=UPI001F556E89|nr:hypothetical protein [Bacteroides fragilis]